MKEPPPPSLPHLFRRSLRIAPSEQSWKEWLGASEDKLNPRHRGVLGCQVVGAWGFREVQGLGPRVHGFEFRGFTVLVLGLGCRRALGLLGGGVLGFRVEDANRITELALA